MKKILLLITIFTILIVADSTIAKKYELVLNVSRDLSKKDIAKNIGVEEKDLLNFWSDKLIISQKFVENLEPTLKGYLENRGFFNANIDIKRDDSKIYIQIDEGKPVRVTDINIKSNFELDNIIDWKKGDVFSSNRFDKIKSKINKKLLSNGYCNAKVDTKAYVDIDKYSSKLNYYIDKGELCYFGKIFIDKKPPRIDKKIILSRLKYKEGDRFDINKIEESYNSLNSLDTFANIQIKYDLDKKTRYVESKISVDKKDKLRKYLIALGADTEIGIRVKGLWEKKDFLGNAKKISIEGSISKNKQEISTQLFTPAFLNLYGNFIDLYLSSGYYYEQTSAYKEKHAYVNSYLDFDYEKWNIKVGLELERLIINLKDYLPNKIGGTYNILYPYLSIIYDGRDSKIDPKNGYYFKLYSEYGLSYGNNSVQYFKYIFESRFIKSFGNLTLSAVGKVGAIHVKSFHLPASKLFYGGGLFSNRAYGKDKIGYITSSKSFSILGGKSFLNLQLEANYKLYKKLYGAIFYDSTMISKDEYNFKGKRVDTLGFGLRYKTPIGPLKIDVGFNIHHPKDYAISIMLGQSF